jgi:pyrroloquinoline-quinone synthase
MEKSYGAQCLLSEIALKYTMTLLIDQINIEIEKQSLLKHKFYQMWQEGKLTLDHLAGYSKEYYQLVKTVPLIVENTLKNNSNPHYEKLIKAALKDEHEHIDPWVKFASSLRVNKEDLMSYSPDPGTNHALDSLLEISSASFIEGAATMYAFEKELPKISETKSAGLKEFYGLHDEASHQYFDIHREVDIYHARMWESILNNCSEEVHEKVLNATRISLKAQNDLLDAVQEKFVEKTNPTLSQ